MVWSPACHAGYSGEIVTHTGRKVPKALSTTLKVIKKVLLFAPKSKTAWLSVVMRTSFGLSFLHRVKFSTNLLV
jgi:hypothetical protein